MGDLRGSLDSAERTLLVRADSMAEFAPPDQVLYVRGDTLFTQTLDIAPAACRRAHTRRAADFRHRPRSCRRFSLQHGRPCSSERTGTAWRRRQHLHSIAHVGRARRPGRTAGRPRARYVYPRIAPDGTRVALDSRDAERDVWIWNFARKTLSRLTFNDVDAVQYGQSTRNGFSFRLAPSAQNLFFWPPTGRARRSASPKAPTHSCRRQSRPTAVERSSTKIRRGTQLNTVELEGSHRVEPLIQTPGTDRNGMISPDGRWIAYESDESGQFEI